MQSECEILKLRKNNLLENIGNQDKILEEKLREGKINRQIKKEILFYWDCDVTKDIEYVNKKWDAKILGMRKAYEKTNVFLKLKKSDAYLSIKLHHRRTLPSAIPTKIWKVLQTIHAPVQNKLVMSKEVIEKLTKYKKTGIANQRNIARKDTT